MGKVVSVIMGLTVLLAMQPVLGSSHLHHDRSHGRLSGHAASLHDRITNRAAFAAGIRAARKLSLLSTRTASAESNIDAQGFMGGSIKQLDARKEETPEQRVNPNAVADHDPQVYMSKGAGHGELQATKQSSIAHGELGNISSDGIASQGREKAESENESGAESIAKDLGTRIAAKPEIIPSLHARNVVVNQDQQIAMEAAEFPIPVKGSKDELAHVSLDTHKKKQGK